jgi:hypothetical protein
MKDKNGTTTFIRSVTEEPIDGADHVGGDVQASDAWSARLIWSAAGRHIVRTAYAYAVGCDEDGTRVAVDVDVTSHHFEIDVMLEEVLCTDPDDPGSSELDADISYPGQGSYGGQTLFTTADEAMAAGQRVIAEWIADQGNELARGDEDDEDEEGDLVFPKFVTLDEPDLRNLPERPVPDGHVRLVLEIENTYELYDDVTTYADVVVPIPPAEDEEGAADGLEMCQETPRETWSREHIYELTGVGHTDGDSWYDVTVLWSSDAALVGSTFDWGY